LIILLNRMRNIIAGRLGFGFLIYNILVGVIENDRRYYKTYTSYEPT